MEFQVNNNNAFSRWSYCTTPKAQRQAFKDLAKGIHTEIEKTSQLTAPELTLRISILKKVALREALPERKVRLFDVCTLFLSYFVGKCSDSCRIDEASNEADVLMKRYISQLDQLALEAPPGQKIDLSFVSAECRKKLSDRKRQLTRPPMLTLRTSDKLQEKSLSYRYSFGCTPPPQLSSRSPIYKWTDYSPPD